ncbi:MAG: glycosyltransferase [Vulcanimicrobiota bacterium]
MLGSFPDPLRVGLFSNIYRPIISGVVNSIDLLRKELLNQGHCPFVFAPRVPGYKDTHSGVWRFPSVHFRQVNYPLALPIWPPTQRAIAQSRLQVVHTHHPFWLGEVAWMWSRIRRIPLVYTFHTQYEQYCHYLKLPQAPLRALTRWSVKNFARRCDLIIAPSPTIREVMSDYGITTWTETLPNAIDLERFQAPRERSSIRQQLGWPLDRPIALYAGRLGREKNLSFLLEAFAHVPEACLAVVGDGPELPALRAQAEGLGLGERVLFAGGASYPAMPDYYGAADLFCIASTTEVKPLVVLEALASHLPVVAVSACGTADTLTHGQDGLLTRERLDEFAGACKYLCRDGEERRRMAEAAGRTAENYSIEGYTRKLVALYQQARARVDRER